MEKNQTNLKILERLAELSVEQSVDTEFTLPDYYPEITRILKNLTQIYFTKSIIKNNKIEIAGQISMTLLYADKEDNFNSFTYSFAFAKYLDTDLTDDCLLNVAIRDEFLNTNAVAQRKVEVHGSLNLSITATAQKSVTLPCEFKENVYSKSECITFTDKYLPIVKSLFLEDEISVGQNRQPISKILRSEAFVKINECKIVSNKFVIKGELSVNILYCPIQSTRPILLEHIHNFSQIVDGDNVTEASLCKAEGKLISFEIHPKTSLDGDVKSVSFEAKVNLEVEYEKETEISFITDAFSHNFAADVECMTLKACKKLDKLEEHFVCKKNLDFTDGSISEIYDVWCKNAIAFAGCENGEILIKGIVNINIIGCDNNSSAVFFERSVDYEYRYNLDEKLCCNFEPNITIAAVNYANNAEGGIDVAVELVVELLVYTIKEHKVLLSLSEKESEPIIKDNDTAITLYFAEEEKVWDIAKRYVADPKKICNVNNIDNIDCICNKILLIPNT